MKRVHDLSVLPWTVEGATPNVWRFERLYPPPFSGARCVDVPPVPAHVPGSVQAALRDAGILPDWEIGLQSRACEWVEHRHWIFRTHLPAEWLTAGARVRLECLGLDYSGWVWLDGREVGTFCGSHHPHTFDLTAYLPEGTPREVALEIIFDLPPRWLGQFGWTSQMLEWKTRFNYTWDWTPRLVQIGIWDGIRLAVVEGGELCSLELSADAEVESGTGILEIRGQTCGLAAGRLELSLSEDGGGEVWSAGLETDDLIRGVRWSGLPVRLWWPNLEMGKDGGTPRPLYTMVCRLINAAGQEEDRLTSRLGFRHVAWEGCEDAPDGSGAWVCRVNGKAIFLQGVNFPPLKSNFADLDRKDYERRLSQYADLGVNLLRINACQFLEREWFYDLCDELGLMVWQEFPLTSSGIENWPPEGENAIAEMETIARSYIARRRHHAALVLWGGGNEQQGSLDGSKTGMGKPCGLDHPMLRRLGEVVAELDPGRRYIPTSPFGPRAGADPADFGKGLHWAVHGPNAGFANLEEAEAYWQRDDALFRPEVYCSGASPAAVIRHYAGDETVFPANFETAYFAHPTPWWVDWQRVVGVYGREPADLEEYVAWSQELHARLVSLGAATCKQRFPRCAGFLLWSGHDTFPIPVNTSLIDYDGNLKPAALALRKIWRGENDRRDACVSK